MTFKDLQKRLESLNFSDKGLFNEIGKKTSQNIKARTRRGFGVDKDGDRAKKLKGLSSPYKKARKKLRATGELSSDTTPAKSNLTRTGKMVDSVDYTATSNSTTVSIKGKDNQRKANDQKKQGRNFMALSKAEIKDVSDIIETKINNDIKKQGL